MNDIPQGARPAAEAASPAKAPTRPQAARADAFTVVAHWALVAAVAVSLATGLTIAADDINSWAGGAARAVSGVLPTGAVIEWHTLSGWAMTAIIFAYAVFLIVSGRLARKLPTRRSWDRLRSSAGAAAQDLRGAPGRPASVAASQEAKAWWAAVNVALYLVAFIGVLVMALTGWALYSGVTLGLGMKTMATLHGVVALGFLLFVLGHVLTHLKRGMLMSIFRPKLGFGVAAVIAALASATAVGAFVALDGAAMRELTIKRVAIAPVLDGGLSDRAWAGSEPVMIHTHRGVNFPDGETDVEVRAVHDGEHVYFAFRWADDTPSSHHLPLVKTNEGWRLLQSEFGVNDEDLFYEDKFSVVMSTKAELGSGTAHLGKDLLPGPHRPTNRGMHYTEDGSLADMWHWKSVRTGGMSPPLIDDNFFGPPLPSERAGKRYTGGYGKDPKDGGGYFTNWEKLEGPLPAYPFVTPKFLPAAAPPVLALGEDQSFETVAATMAASVLPHGEAHLMRADAVAYDAEMDDLPVGSVIPGVVIKSVFTGDRGDVRGAPKWADGYWTLEARRKLDTGSEYDVALTPDAPVYLWVSAFNHTQTRHTQHLRPIALMVE